MLDLIDPTTESDNTFILRQYAIRVIAVVKHLQPL